MNKPSDEITFVLVNLDNEEHCLQMIRLLDAYMSDEMGNGIAMPESLAPEIIRGLKGHPAYVGFFVLVGDQYAALANCNKNFSTFKARPLINIHDLIVHPDFRGMGIGKFLLDSIAVFAREIGCCRINLEVRSDNLKARKLYRKCGYGECFPSMLFWEKNL